MSSIQSINIRTVYTNTTESTALSTGALIVNGGVSVAKSLNIGSQTTIGGVLRVLNTENSTSSTTGSLIVDGGIGLSKNLYVGGNLDIGGTFGGASMGISSTTESTDITTGAMVIAGGVGIAKNLNIGGRVKLISTTETTSIDTGSFNVLGGVGITKSLFVGGSLHIINTSEASDTTSGSVIISGGVGIAKNFYVGGNESVIGTLTIINTTSATSTDSGSVTISGGVGIKENIHIGGNEKLTGTLNVINTSSATSTDSGAIVVSGGVGIKENVYVGGIFHAFNTSGSTSTNSGSIIIGGGAGIKENVYVGGNEYITGTLSVINTSSSTSTGSGSIVIGGGIGIKENMYVGGNENLTGILSVINTTSATSTSTGAIVVSGGVGVKENIYAGGIIHAINTTSATSTDTGSVVVSGGLGVKENVHIGGNEKITGNVSILSTSQSTSTNSGSLVVGGGMGVGGVVYSGGLNLDNSQTVTSVSTNVDLDANSDSVIPTQRAVRTYVNQLATLLNNPTGFPNTTDSSISTDDQSRTFSISPVNGSFNYYINNVRYTKTAVDSIEIENTTGIHFIYYDGSTLQSTMVFTLDLFSIFAYVASLYWNATASKFIHVGDERHGTSMSPDTHRDLHYGLGTVYISGLTPGDFTIGDGSSDDHAIFTIGGGVILDEDLSLDIAGKEETLAEIRCLYITPSGWNSHTTNGAYWSDGNTLMYNSVNGQDGLAPVTDGYYVLGHLLATNDTKMSVILGQNQYATLDEAQRAAANEITSINLTGLPIEDWLFVASVIYQSNSTFTNSMKGRIVEVAAGSNYIDWREKKLNSTVGTSNSHSGLSGLTNDDHIQYVRVSGRSTDIVTITNTISSTSATTGAIQVSGGMGIGKDIYIGGENMTLENTSGKYNTKVTQLSSPITISQSSSGIVHSLTYTHPIEVTVQIVGYDVYKTNLCLCKTTYVFMKYQGVVTSFTGTNGSPESLYSTEWNFNTGAFSYTVGQDDLIEISFTNNGTSQSDLNIGTVIISTSSGIIPV